jgi:sigma-B regulation protein RsbU (phosphoserine phosphatase)
METLEDELSADTNKWFELQSAKVQQIAGLAKLLNERVRGVALQKREETEEQLWISLVLAATVIFSSLLLAWAIARGVTKNVSELEEASRRVGRGDLETRVHITSGDELGELGDTFNEMMRQLAHAQSVMQEQVRMASELEIAANLQRALLPPMPQHPDFEFAGVMLPADEVGGDFYDVLTDSEHRYLWLTIGDVSEHGLSAGLVMLMTQSAFASQFHGSPTAAPSDVYRHVNRTLRQNVAERLKDQKYVTAQVLTYQGNGRFSCAGGHEWPVIFRAGSKQTEVVEAAGPWLGIVDELPDVPMSTLTLEHEDILCLYSDGIIEARNEAGELFDMSRFEAVLREAAATSKKLSEIAQHVIEKARMHCDKREDDWTMLLVRRKPA